MIEENEFKNVDEIIRVSQAYGAPIGPRPQADDRLGEGPRVQVVRGKPDTFLSQQSGMFDRYLVPGRNGGAEVLEFLPIDSTKFIHNKVDMTVWYDINDMPWYVSGYVKDFKGHEMLQEIYNILDPAVDKLEQVSKAASLATASAYVFDKKVWDQTLLEVRNMIEIVVSSERPYSTEHTICALALAQNKEERTMRIFDNNFLFVEDDIYAKLSVPTMENRDLVNWKRYSGWFDIKVKFLVWWFCDRMFGSVSHGAEVLRIALTLRILGPQSVKNMIAKMAVSLSPEFDERTCAVLAVFQEAMTTLFERDSELVPLKTGVSKLRLLTKTVGDISRAQKGDYMSRYFGGNTELSGSGTLSYAWLINGDRATIDGSSLTDYAFIPLEGGKAGLIGQKENDPFELRELITRRPFLAGPPTTDQTAYIQYTDEDDNRYDGFPFRTQTVGGLVSSEQRSYFDPVPSMQSIIIPKVVNNPRFSFSPEGFVEALRSGNISEFKGDASIPVGSWELNKLGKWVR